MSASFFDTTVQFFSQDKREIVTYIDLPPNLKKISIVNNARNNGKKKQCKVQSLSRKLQRILKHKN